MINYPKGYKPNPGSKPSISHIKISKSIYLEDRISKQSTNKLIYYIQGNRLYLWSSVVLYRGVASFYWCWNLFDDQFKISKNPIVFHAMTRYQVLFLKKMGGIFKKNFLATLRNWKREKERCATTCTREKRGWTCNFKGMKEWGRPRGSFLFIASCDLSFVIEIEVLLPLVISNLLLPLLEVPLQIEIVIF